MSPGISLNSKSESESDVSSSVVSERSMKAGRRGRKDRIVSLATSARRSKISWRRRLLCSTRRWLMRTWASRSSCNWSMRMRLTGAEGTSVDGRLVGVMAK